MDDANEVDVVGNDRLGFVIDSGRPFVRNFAYIHIQLHNTL